MTEPRASGMMLVGPVMCRSEPQMPQFFHFQDQFVRGGLGVGDCFDNKRLAHFPKNCGAHGGPLISVASSGQAYGMLAPEENRNHRMTAITYASARDMLAKLKAKKISARELLDAHVARQIGRASCRERV